MPCKHHDPFLNAEYEEQNSEYIELDQTILRVKESVSKSEIKVNEALTREVENLTSGIARAVETAHQELQKGCRIRRMVQEGGDRRCEAHQSL